MATLWITELKALPKGTDGGTLPVARLPAVAEQTVTFSTAAQSAAFAGNTRFIRVYADADCCFAVGDDPSATSSNTPMAADSPEYFGVEPGSKLSVVAR